jgi:hypothetical protein
MIQPLEAMARMMKDKLLAYGDIKEQREIEKAEKVKEFAEKNNLPVPQSDAPIAQPTAVRTAAGTSFTTKRWTFRLVDISKVPDDYKILDEVKVRAMIRAMSKTVGGVSKCDLTILGIDIYQESDISVRT